MVKKRRTAKQIAATKKLIAFNKKRHTKTRRKKSHKGRRSRRSC